MLVRLSYLLAAVMVLLTGCALPAPSGGSSTAPEQVTQSLTLRTVMRVEPVSIAAKALQSSGISVAHAVRMFNANLDMTDSRENPLPYLAEALPVVNTDSWKVLPDGRMETSYHLKPNLVWHDGTPLSAEDFVFSWKVYATPELGAASGRLLTSLAEVVAPDERSLIFRWSRIYPDAAQRVFGAKGLVATLNNEGMLDIRNKAAHDEVLSRDEARQTRSWAMQILGQV